jgi:hypothetical protein
MPLCYSLPPDDGRLLQGEIIGPVWEYVPLRPPVEAAAETQIDVRGYEHSRMVVLTQDCDLLWDFALRAPEGSLANELADVTEKPKSVPSVLLCDMFENLRERVAGGDILARAKRNQDERYHALAEAPVGEDDSGATLPELFLDFRKTFSPPTAFLYQGLQSGQVCRIAVVPPFHIHDVVHRFHSYHSRIAIED